VRTAARQWGTTTKGWAAKFGDHQHCLQALDHTPPERLYTAKVAEVGRLLVGLLDVGLPPFEAGLVACIHWQVDAMELVRVCLLEHAHEQWTDGELLALLEDVLAPLNEQTADATLTGLHPQIVRVRQLARGELRTRTWALLDATKPIVVKDGDKTTIEHVPDSKVRWAVARELQRQYCGWTTKGMAEAVQRELELLERKGRPDLSRPGLAH
jgi:hypothetical protein